jgi:hypothetical protein
MRAPTATSDVRSPDELSIPDLVSQPPRTVRTAVVATVVGLLAFLLVQSLLAVYTFDDLRGFLDHSSFDVRGPLFHVAVSLTHGGVSYLVLAVAGAAIAVGGHRVAFVLPAAAWVLVSAVVGAHQPEPIGSEWNLECLGACSGGPWFAHPWVGPLVDLALVLAPGWAVGRRVVPRRWPGRVDAAAIASILTCSAAVATALWAISVIERGADERAVVATAALGLALGVARPWWPWLHVVFAASAAGFIGLALHFFLWTDHAYSFTDELPYAVGRVWPIAAVGVIASGWQPLAWAIRKLQERPLRLVAAVNILNAVDAVMTLLAVRSGGAFEANPIVRFAGLPAKIVLVGLLTWLLYRRKPSALVWPFAALLWVAGYHVAGILVNGWR